MDSKRRTKNSIIISFIFSILLICGLMFATTPNLFVKSTKYLWILGWIYLFLFMYEIAGKKLRETIQEQDNLFSFLVLPMVISVLVVCILPFRYSKILEDNMYEKNILQSENIIIETLSEKNEKSGGYGVCIEGIILNNTDYNMYEIPLTEGWEFVEGRPYTNSADAEQLVVEIGYGNNFNLMIRRNNVAGKIRVYIGEYSGVFDLYSEKAVDREILDLSKVFERETQEKEMGKEITYYVCYYVIIFLLITSIYAYYVSYKKRKN